MFLDGLFDSFGELNNETDCDSKIIFDRYSDASDDKN